MNTFGSFGLFIGFCLISVSASSNLERPGKVIIDTDAGSDDAAAILLALVVEEQSKDSGFEVIAITCSYGNTKVTNVKTNVLKVLTIAKRNDIPVYVGSSKPLMQNYTMDYHFGRDGLGDVEFREKIKGRIGSKHASVALVDLARKHAGNLSILAFAPLTNIAIATMLDPNFVDNVERFYIMGSSPYGRGSIAPNTDFNFYQDPESNFIVLNSTMSPPAVLLPSGISSWASIPMKWRTDVLGALDSRIIKFLNGIERRNFNGPIWKSADLILTALVLWPELITRTVSTNITPVFDGAARGAVLVDYRNVTGKPINAQLLETFDVGAYQQLLLKSFS